MADIKDVANFFLSKEPMSNKKIQKLSYYAVAWGYALLDTQIADNAEFEAWVHGPVSPVLYQEYKGRGWREWEQVEKDTTMFDADELSVLESVWATYGDQDANSLEALTHSETPWMIARSGLGDFENGSTAINPSIMKEFYRSIYLGD